MPVAPWSERKTKVRRRSRGIDMPATNMQMDIGLVLLTAVEANVDGSGCGDLQSDPEAHTDQADV